MKLSEFKDEKGIEVVAKLLVPIGKIASNVNNRRAKNEGKSLIEFASSMLQNNPKETMNMLAILDDKDPESYHCNAATILVDVINMFADEELLKLFGLQSQKMDATSSGSASENIDAEA